jgi:uncharacterized membrane protein YfcA
MHFHDLILSVIAFVSEILGTLSGFGSSTFFVPIALFVESFKFVLALTAILHCFGNFSKIVLFRNNFRFVTFFKLAVPSVIFTGIGALLTTKLSSEFLVRSLGIALMIFSIWSLFAKRRIQRLPNWAAVCLISISGFCTGLVGTGGAIRGLALTALQLPKNSFVAISSAIDMGGDLLRAIIYIKNGYMDWTQWFYLPFLGIAAFAGASVGKKVLNHINQNQFEKLVTAFIFLSGLMMVIKK